MFETLVLVCVIHNLTMCQTLADTEGPYSTRDRCIQRAYEIASELPMYLPEFTATQYMCVEQVKGTRI
jgi:hypothetical protein|tara:strand:+ start:314 stop:517 length:204 start_codon:yes stop_codon:yes gene_type:complete